MHSTVQLTPFAKEFVNRMAGLYDKIRQDQRRLIRKQFPDNPVLVAPAVFNVAAHWVDGASITINWDTDKPCTRLVDFGFVAVPDGSWDSVDNSSVVATTPHSLTIDSLDWGTNPTLYYKITAEDSEGNSTTTEIRSVTRASFGQEDAQWRALNALSDELFALIGFGDPITGDHIRIAPGGILDVTDALGASKGKAVKQALITAYFTADHGQVINFADLKQASGAALPTFANAPKVVIVNPKNPPSNLEYWNSIQETVNGFTMVALDLAASPGSVTPDTSFGGAGEDATGSYNATDSATTVGTGDAIVKSSPGSTIQQLGVDYQFTPPFSVSVFPGKFGEDIERPNLYGSGTLTFRAGTYSGGVFTTRSTQTRSIGWASDGEAIFDSVYFTGLDSPSSESELWVKADYAAETSTSKASTFEITQLTAVGVASDTAVNDVQYIAIIIELFGSQ